MKKFLTMSLMVLGIISLAVAQIPQPKKAVKKLAPINADCKSAIKISFGKIGAYGPTVAPNGSGAANEIRSTKKSDPFSFEKEHNSAWYYFSTIKDGELVIEIIPDSIKDDYDFMLFKYTDSTFCDQVAKKKIKPVRTNISRSGKGGESRTGLSNQGESEYIHAGLGESFSKSLPVKKGEQYYLVVDNVYSEGGGHTIRLGYERIFELSGTVLDEDQKPVKTEVILEDGRGNTVVKTESDSSGQYQMAVKLWESAPYTISFIEDSCFVQSQNFNTANLVKTNYRFKDIKTVMPKLRGGRKYTLGGINFYGDSPELLPTSYSSVNALVKLMDKNKKMIIRIEGHVNHPLGADKYSKFGFLDFQQSLSEMRAVTVCQYLLAAGISEERMSTIGFSNKFMLYPKPKSEEEMMKNRRVEINVISIK